MSKLLPDEKPTMPFVKPAGKQQGMTHAPSCDGLVPRCPACACQQESGRRRHRKRQMTSWAWRAVSEKLVERSHTSVHQSMNGVDVWVSAAEPKLYHTRHHQGRCFEPPHKSAHSNRLLNRCHSVVQITYSKAEKMERANSCTLPCTPRHAERLP